MTSPVDKNTTVTKISDEERLKLAAKLDKELDDFIDSLGGKKYTDGWPEDKWQEEMEKHPFFMKQAPKPGDEVHPLFEGMQQLKYDPEENTADELALNYKEDGNFYIKHRKFRTAIYAFTEGLKARSENSETNAILYNNRSAANYFLQNYRSSYLDALQALKLKPDYDKARWRAAQCAFFIKNYEECLKYCNDIIENNSEDEKAKELLKKCKTEKLIQERNERKQQLLANKKQIEFKKVVDALEKRKIKFDDIGNNKLITEELLKPKFLPLEDFPCKVDKNGVLSWPAAFSYPEFLFSDFQQILNEEIVMEKCLEDMLPLPCDTSNNYRIGNLSVYYENRKAGKVFAVNLNKTIKEIVNEKNFYVSGGSLLFYVVPRNSDVEKEFIQAERRPMVY
ncbi:DNA polymerase interacting tetratricopeptide repeat-containing, protein of 47 kDa isoform X2 [Condylostylus longicornis]|uniref:DNA polymerase interacting tetratricopeptide repeat-containing, protein of 47 kDa isoform X2 n=1 Tax=Condylostylus longicornis TaxID=2530218 RepID=UPI00244E2D76|nr:DNA polymerase interacting tetratricopeptide repeat-containing, protein of 47 kDa isoform X2 [Condylostylus longicornis]